MTESFMEALAARQAEGRFVCVGLDSKWSKLPPHLLADDRGHNPQWVFNRHIVDATGNVAGAFKINRAFYPGVSGLEAIERTVGYIHATFPGIPVIGDGKWNDIGNTNDGYVEDLFGFIDFDAITVNPYLGKEAMEPFLACGDKGIIVLCRTSNPGAGEFQDVIVSAPYYLPGQDRDDPDLKPMKRQQPLYQYIAGQVADEWNHNGNCAVVVGATVPEELAKVREIVGDMPILIPGIGAQGGDLEATVKAGANSKGEGMIINSSRGIIFARSTTHFAEAAAEAAQKLHDEITATLVAA